jgi:hypothetical protein
MHVPQGQAALTETPKAAAAEMARAQVEARTLVAMRRPRNWDVVRQDMLRDCARKSFAKAAIYTLPYRPPVSGLSIRFAEAAAQHMGNLDMQAQTIFEDEERVILAVSVSDLEKNNRYSTEIEIAKVVERKFVKDGDEVVGTRQNQRGETNYLIRAGEQEMLPKRGAAISKAFRTNLLRVLPAWLKEEAQVALRATAVSEVADDPDKARKGICDAFLSELGVKAASLATYLGHDLSEATPDELVDLRAAYQTVRDGLATWHELLSAKTGVASDGDEQDERTSAIRAKLEETKAKLAARRATKRGVQQKSVPDAQAREAFAPEIDPVTGEVVPPAREPGED